MPNNNMFYWKHSDQVHYPEDIKQLLTPGVLEDDAESYYELLLKSQEYGIDVKDILNDNTLYQTWFSPHILCLSYLVGEAKNDYDDDLLFYGSNNKEGIPEELGIKIFYKMLELGADLDIRNYYGENMLDSLSNFKVTNRINKNFKCEVSRYFNSKL